ncbi:MAG: hypothetical protein HC802_16585 [Caldilineaceae bacterium]|nr:hypothetical protein [Caldilineaceae bacterium]
MNKIRDHLALKRYPNLAFWLCFVLLNGLFFVPFYALNTDSSTLWPLTGLDAERGQVLHQLLVWRDNLDFFRLSAEFVLLVSLWVFVARVRVWFVRPWMVAVTLVSLLYYLYEALLVTLYQVEPVFYVHYFLIADGLHFLLEHLGISTLTYVGMAMVAALAVAGVSIAAWILFSPQVAEGMATPSKWVLAVLLLGRLRVSAINRRPRQIPEWWSAASPSSSRRISARREPSIEMSLLSTTRSSAAPTTTQIIR